MLSGYEKAPVILPELSDCRKSLVLDALLLYLLVFIYDSKLPIVLFVRQHFSGSLFERYTCQYERGRQPKGSGTSLSLAYARLVHSAKAPLDLTAPLPVP